MATEQQVQVNFRMPVELKAQLEASAQLAGRTVTAELVHRLQLAQAYKERAESFEARAQAVEARARVGEVRLAELQAELSSAHKEFARIRTLMSEQEQLYEYAKRRESEAAAERERLTLLLDAERQRNALLVENVKLGGQQFAEERERWRRTDDAERRQLQAELQVAEAAAAALKMHYRHVAIFFHLFIVAFRAMYKVLPQEEQKNPFYAPLLLVADEVAGTEGEPAELLTRFLGGEVQPLVAARIQEALDMLLKANALARDGEAVAERQGSESSTRAQKSPLKRVAGTPPKQRD